MSSVFPMYELFSPGNICLYGLIDPSHCEQNETNINNIPLKRSRKQFQIPHGILPASKTFMVPSILVVIVSLDISSSCDKIRKISPPPNTLRKSNLSCIGDRSEVPLLSYQENL